MVSEANTLYCVPSGIDPEEYWGKVGESPDHLVVVHCSNYGEPEWRVLVFSTLQKAEQWVAGMDYDCVVYTTAMADNPEYGNDYDA